MLDWRAQSAAQQKAGEKLHEAPQLEQEALRQEIAEVHSTAGSAISSMDHHLREQITDLLHSTNQD